MKQRKVQASKSMHQVTICLKILRICPKRERFFSKSRSIYAKNGVGMRIAFLNWHKLEDEKMKQVFLGLVIVFFSVGASAAPRDNVRAELVLRPTFEKLTDKVLSISVYGSKEVILQEYRITDPTDRFVKRVARLSPAEMQTVEGWIAEARNGEVIQFSPSKICMALATQERVVRADNGKLLLYRAAEICPDTITKNTDPAAQKLHRYLDGLLRKYEER